MAADEPVLKRVLFAGGGTGGHVYMAVALAQGLEARHRGVEVLFVGTRRGLESRILPPLGYRLETIEVAGINRVGWRRAVSALLQVPASLRASWRIVRRFAPSVVVGVGGYAAGPVVVAARLAGVPALLIEPNAWPGLTNRLLKRWVAKAAVAYAEAEEYFGAKAVLTGVPIREDFEVIGPPAVGSPLRLLILGGSQGSVGVNRLVSRALADVGGPFTAVHQAGARDAATLREFYQGCDLPVTVEEFLDPMPAYLADSDLVISRAGASAVAEISAAGRASILIPFPHAADDHQRRNAQALAAAGAALLFEEETGTPEALATLLNQLADDPKRLVSMGRSARELSPRDSTNRVIDVMEAISR